MKPEPIYKSIGAIIRGKRRQLEMPQEILAGQLGIKRATLANIETGRQRVLVHQLYALAEALKVKAEDLLPPLSTNISEADLADVPTPSNLNTQQQEQIARVIAEVTQSTLKSTGQADGKSSKAKHRNSSARIAR